ncbi:MAG: hypothetical protein IJL60_10060 [Clostridiales bacterium]|nr:hypothetical protein [Clostridiales bacterium]
MKSYISFFLWIMTIMMLLSLNGCKKKEDPTSFDSVSNPSSITSPVPKQSTNKTTQEPTIYDPTWRPYSYPPPETAPLEESYEYVIFSEVDNPTVLNLPVEIDEYISEKDGVPHFTMDSLAIDYGWKLNTASRFEDGKTVEYSYYYYDCGEMWIYLEFEFLEDDHTDGEMRNCLGRIKYAFIYPDEPEHYYYEPDNEFASPTNNAYVYLIRNVMKQELYQVKEEEEYYAYKDEIILMTYVFSFVSRYPEYNPFCFEAFETWRECDYYPISNEYPWDQYEAAGW